MPVKKDQHMMADSDTIRKIVAAARIRPDDTVLEIGAGSGALTRELAKKTHKLIAVEIDGSFERRLSEIGGITVVIGNILDEMEKLKFDKIVANIPYAICEPLMHSLFGCGSFSMAVLTVPKGFADILLAKRGEVAYSRLSAMARAFFSIKVLMGVPRSAFEPPPDTESVVVEIKPRRGNALQKEALKRQKLRTKNAVMRALFAAKKTPKKQAKEAIKTLKLSNNLLEKRLSCAGLDELDAVLAALEKLEKSL